MQFYRFFLVIYLGTVHMTEFEAININKLFYLFFTATASQLGNMRNS